ncbi:hypothetical protein, partial [Actinomadura sp. BRA 177]|uniref:hypothetical protein n=1 Tax=Actinomadura sp. BRA 177 TaxID=2745202 RepID=UPI0020CE0869
GREGLIETVRPGYRVPAEAGTIDASVAAEWISAARRGGCRRPPGGFGRRWRCGRGLFWRAWSVR